MSLTHCAASSPIQPLQIRFSPSTPQVVRSPRSSSFVRCRYRKTYAAAYSVETAVTGQTVQNNTEKRRFLPGCNDSVVASKGWPITGDPTGRELNWPRKQASGKPHHASTASHLAHTDQQMYRVARLPLTRRKLQIHPLNAATSISSLPWLVRVSRWTPSPSFTISLR